MAIKHHCNVPCTTLLLSTLQNQYGAIVTSCHPFAGGHFRNGMDLEKFFLYGEYPGERHIALKGSMCVTIKRCHLAVSHVLASLHSHSMHRLPPHTGLLAIMLGVSLTLCKP